MNGAETKRESDRGELVSSDRGDQNSFEVEEKRDIPFPTLVISVLRNRVFGQCSPDPWTVLRIELYHVKKMS